MLLTYLIYFYNITRLEDEKEHLATKINELNTGNKKYQHFLYDFYLSNHLIHFYNIIRLITNNDNLINQLDVLKNRNDKLNIENNK